nr:MAG: ORF3 [Giant panda anellovirus]
MTLGTSFQPRILEKMDSSNQKHGNESPDHLLKILDSLIIQEKQKMNTRRRRRTRTLPLTPPKKIRRIHVPRDVEYPEGDWTEADLTTSSDSDTY